MNKIKISESSLKKLVKLIKEEEYEDEESFDDYDDETYYSIYDYLNVIEKYLDSITAKFNYGYSERDGDKIYLDMLEFKIYVALDSETGILYIDTIGDMYTRQDAATAHKIDNLLVSVINYINQNPLNVTQMVK